jgi:3'-5' exonuclease
MTYKDFLYFDIETCGNYKDLDSLRSSNEREFKLFIKKYEKNPYMNSKDVDISYLNNCSLIPTFGKILCISFGYYTEKNSKGYTISSLYGEDEKSLITEFNEILHKASLKSMWLSGYNITGFDIPWILRKTLKYKLPIPKLIDTFGIKPWETAIFDLSDEWKQKYYHYSSLDEVAYDLGIDSPKDNMDGSMVHSTYWNDNNIDNIKEYCEKDVLATMIISKNMLQNSQKFS